VEAFLELGRFITYAAALQLFGVAVFQHWLAGAGLRAALQRNARAIAAVSALGLLVGELIWLAATAGTMGDGWTSATDPATIWLVLSATAFGRIWIFVLALSCGLAFAAVASPRWGPPAWGSIALLVSLALVGHSAIGTGYEGLLNRVSQTIHLTSSAFWVGSLLPLLLCLRFFRHIGHAAEAEAALRRFSGLGHYAVAALILSGVANTWFVLQGAVDLAQPYQQLLLLKIAIAGLMCCLALINRYAFMPRIPNGGPGLRLLAQGTIAEMVLGGAVLGLVSVIGTLSPSP
jgi:putative copper resistance protein D